MAVHSVALVEEPRSANILQMLAANPKFCADIWLRSIFELIDEVVNGC